MDPKVLARMQSSAKMLLNCNYPEELKTQMQQAYDRGQYGLVSELAANHDVLKRESLDSKIKMVIPKPELDPELAPESAMLDAAARGKLEPKFVAEGVEGYFDSAAKAIEAYKIKNGIAVPDKKKYTFRLKPLFVEKPPSEAPGGPTPEELCLNHGKVEQMLKEMFSEDDVVEDEGVS